MKSKQDKIKNLIGEPCEGIDYYLDELRQYTVFIEVAINGFKEKDDKEDICGRAVEAIEQRKVDPNAEVVFSKKIRDVILDWTTDLPFDRDEWERNKLRELGLNESGDALRTWEKPMPVTQRKLVSP